MSLVVPVVKGCITTHGDEGGGAPVWSDDVLRRHSLIAVLSSSTARYLKVKAKEKQNTGAM